MTRRELREVLFLFLFRKEFYSKEEMQEQLALIESDFPATDERDILLSLDDQDRAYVENKANAILEHLDEIDAAINEKATGWKTARMGKVDLTLIRLAVYEIKYEDDIPVGVSINEAVELAKSFGTDESGKFVNGVLAKFAKEEA